MVNYLGQQHHKNISPILTQVLRSGTSIMANVCESEFAQSKADFITKLHISLKEANETSGWLELLHNGSYLTDQQYQSIDFDCGELIALLVSSIKTSKNINKREK